MCYVLFESLVYQYLYIDQAGQTHNDNDMIYTKMKLSIATPGFSLKGCFNKGLVGWASFSESNWSCHAPPPIGNFDQEDVLPAAVLSRPYAMRAEHLLGAASPCGSFIQIAL